MFNFSSFSIFQATYFHDVGVKTLSYLDSLYQWDNLQKSKFYKGLPQIIPTLPRVNLYSILPYLVKEFVNSPMLPFVLPNALLIAEMSSQKEYCDHILPHLKPIFKITSEFIMNICWVYNVFLCFDKAAVFIYKRSRRKM